MDADDVLAALDAVLAHAPDLDPEHVGFLGGSYGGFMATWLAGHSDRFAAACSERAANNLLSLEWGGSDAAGFFRFEFGGISHLDQPDLYTRLSPITYAADIAVPMLLLHADEDLRCPPDQADQLYLALRLLGREVEYWRFPDEGHDLSRGGSPRHRVARAEIILNFFARHLGGAPSAAGAAAGPHGARPEALGGGVAAAGAPPASGSSGLTAPASRPASTAPALRGKFGSQWLKNRFSTKTTMTVEVIAEPKMIWKFGGKCR